MSKAKRLLAALLTVIMAVSMMTFSAFAAGEKTFAEDYVCKPADEDSAVIKNTAVIYTSLAKNKEKGTQITVPWDGENYIFIVGDNAFDNYTDAYKRADILADGGIAQILLNAEDYLDITITSEVQIFGTHWKDNPNTVNTTDPTKTWALNSAWNSNKTTVHDFQLRGGALGTVDIYGVEITHRFYDCFRTVNNSKTVITLCNVNLNQTDTTTSTLTGAANSRSYVKCAMTFWNPHSANTTASTLKNNKDEVYIKNFRVSKLNMDSGGDNRFIDERVAPFISFDGFCVDYANANLRYAFWMKWQDGLMKTRCTVENSYFTYGGTANTGNQFDFEGYVSNNGVEGDYSEIIFDNNIFYNAVFSNGTPNMRIYQGEYDKVTINNNLFVSTGTAKMFNWSSVGGGDLSEAVEMKDNTFLGYSSLYIDLGSEATQIDMTGSHIQAAYSSNYKSKSSGIIPTGHVKFDYCYVDGARTVKTSEVQTFTVEGATVDHTAKTLSMTGNAGFYYLTPVVDGLVTYEVYESDAQFSNAASLEDAVLLDRFVLKEQYNYFLFVVYSPDKTNYTIYKATVIRPETNDTFLVDHTEAGVISDGMLYEVTLDKDVDNFGFVVKELPEGTDIDRVVNVTEGNKKMEADADGYYTVSDLERGDVIEVRVGTKGTTTNYYTFRITRPYNTVCEIVEMDSKVTFENGGYVAGVSKNAKSYSFKLKVSEDATAYVHKGTTVYELSDGKITIDNVKAGEYTLSVVAEDGVTANSYKLTVKNIKSTEAKVVSVSNAKAANGGFTASAKFAFTVDAKVSAGATYVVYEDAECTIPLEDNTIYVPGEDEPGVGYIVVTAEDGKTKSAPIPVTVTYSDAGITVEGAEDLGIIQLLELKKDVEETTLKITAKDCTYKLYADANLSVPFKNPVNLDASTVAVYAELTYKDGAKDYVTIMVVSPRSAIAYTDAKKIPGWAKVYVDILNEAQVGLIKGDEKGNFNPANGMTRYEIAAIATRLMGVDVSQFASVKLTYADSIAKWAENYVKAVTKLGIMTGSKNAKGKLEFNGSATTTRAQLAKVMTDVTFYGTGMTASEVYAENKAEIDAAYKEFKFADDKDVANWAVPFVRTSVALGIFEGSKVDGKNYFNPNANILRQEIAVVLAKMSGLEVE